jgi:hypothetical protein
MSEHDQTKEVVSPDDPKTEATPNEEKVSSGRRQFFTGMATALGAGVILHATNNASASEKSATDVRSRILSRIQSDLQRSQNEMLFGYDKPDSATPHGRYVKPDKPAEEEVEGPAN